MLLKISFILIVCLLLSIYSSLVHYSQFLTFSLNYNYFNIIFFIREGFWVYRVTTYSVGDVCKVFSSQNKSVWVYEVTLYSVGDGCKVFSSQNKSVWVCEVTLYSVGDGCKVFSRQNKSVWVYGVTSYSAKMTKNSKSWTPTMLKMLNVKMLKC